MKKELVGIAILPPDDYIEFVREKERYISQKYNTNKGLLQPPHVTIKWPFETNDITIIEKYCQELARQITPFKVEIDGYGFFEPKVIFLKVISSDQIVKLHLKIIKELKKEFGIDQGSFEGENQQFHTTLAYDDISKEDFYKAKTELESAEQPKMSFIFDSIGLFRFSGKEWIIHKKINVKND